MLITPRLLPRRMRSLFALLCALAVVAQTARALDPSRSLRHYRLDTWTTEQGLPHNSISGIIQTSDGFLWIATLRGVVRFDGIQFQPLTVPSSIAMRCRNYLSLVETPDGSVWIATEGGGLLRVKDDSVSAFDTEHGFPDDHIQCLALDSAGGLWIGTWSRGVVRLTPPYDMSSAKHLTTKNSLPSDGILDICAGDGSDVWLTTVTGNLAHVYFRDTPAVVAGPASPGGQFFSLMKRRDGTVCVSTTEGLFGVVGSTLIRELPTSPRASDYFVTMLEDKDGNFWGGTYLTGLTRRTPPAQGQIIARLTKEDGLAGNYVSSLCEDAEGSLWIGTEVGLNRLSDGSFITLTEADGFTDDVLSAMIQAPDGTIWGGTDGGGLLKIQDGRVVRRFVDKDGIRDQFVTAATFSNTGSLLFATRDGTVYEMKAGTAPTKLFSSPHAITSFLQTPNNELWCSTSAGVVRYAGPAYRPVASPFDGHQEPGTCLATTRSGALWAGTRHGLFVLDNSSFRAFHSSDGLPNEYITCLKEDTAGVLWIGTPSGVGRYRQGHFERFDTAGGLLDRYVTSIIQDGRGFLWFGTLSGVYRIARADFDSVTSGAWHSVRPVSFMETDGMKSSECAEGNNVSLFDRMTGRIWFSTTQGLAIVNPDLLRFHPVLGRLRIQRMTIPDGKEFSLPPFELSAGENNFTIHYTLPAFLLQSHLRFQYRLEEFDQTWVNADNRRYALYTNVPPGSYTFVVRAWSDLPGSVPVVKAGTEITIAPHFYQRRLFYAAIAVLVLAGLLGSHVIRVRRAEQRERTLSRMVDQRTSDLMMEITERKRIETALRASETHRKAILQVMPLVLYTAQTPDQFGATWITDNTEEVTGFPAERFLREPNFWSSRIHPEDKKKTETFLSMLRSGNASDIEYRWQCADGTYHWFLDHAVRIQVTPEGRLEYSGVWFDITDKMEAEEQLRVSLHDKELLLREVHHRVKNNLTIITSLLSLQAGTIEEQKVRDVLREAEGRVRSMATLHEHLYRSEDLGAVDLKSYIVSLVRTLSRTYGRPGVNIMTRLEGVTLDIALAIPCGLIVNELVTNAMKYAFPAEKKGEIVVSLRRESDHELVLEVCDNGEGFTPPPDLDESPTLGLKLVSILSRQLGGTARFTTVHGTTCTVRFSDDVLQGKPEAASTPSPS